jgi:hypothetical protein
MDITILRKTLREQFAAAYSLNDAGHQFDHCERVYQTGIRINDSLGKRYDPRLIMLAAYLIDMFSWSRVNHHLLSHLWVTTTDHSLLNNLSSKERTMLGLACKQHRASYTGSFSHEFAELISAADREFPGDIPTMIDRAVKYRAKWHPEMSAATRQTEAIKHLKEKFGTDGYARYPAMFEHTFKGELAKQRIAIDAL